MTHVFEGWRGEMEWTVYIDRADADGTSLIREVNKQTPLKKHHNLLIRLGANMDMLNIKPLSKDLEWSQEASAGAGTEATGAGGPGAAAAPQACSSGEERALRRVVGRWGTEWLS
ncbi:hypothetical protein PYW08_005265 [Mythimna loreyi]|uniref:Uncharacterized protein n=1 Tax=Mythimna loreyi TaxID=667449 RepID=A0ACC2QGG8_9NEOP|nr:hypothetical protein PYW08_005265 [Mythimna loreyi]